MKIQFNDNIPIYRQIIDYVKGKIISGELNAGQRLPSIRELADKFEVTPNTIQRVYRELEYERLTYTERGSGTFVTKNTEIVEQLYKKTIKDEIARFYERMYQYGLADDIIFQYINEYKERGV